MAHVVQFVDQVVASPGLRLNLNDGKVWTTLDNGTGFPPPPRRRALAQTMMTDGARVTADVYDNRTISLHLMLNASTADAQATQIQLLARELDRPANVLMWKPDAMTQPVFFRTFGSDVTSVVETLVTLRTAVVTILAEPFAYGPEVILSPVTVNNDPSLSNGLFWDVTGVLGDVETPVVFRMPTDQVAGSRQSLFATRRRGTPSAMSFIVQAEACSQNTDTTTQANDAAMSGASNNFSRCTYGTAGMTKRLTTPAPTSSKDIRGQYRVFVRTRHSVAGNVHSLQLKWNNGQFTNTAVTVPTDALIRFVDLGLISMPLAPDPIFDGYSNTEQPVAGQPTELWAQRVSGAGTIDFDFFVFVPADDQTTYVSWVSPAISSDKAVWDGQREMVYLTDATDNVYSQYVAGLSAVVGGPINIMPGVTNRIFFLRDVGTQSATTDPINNSTPITVSYFPRYLYVRPAAT